MDIRLDFAGDSGATISIAFVVLLLCWIVQTVGRVRIASRNAEVWSRLVDKLDPADVCTLLAHGGAQTLEAILAGPERPYTRIISAAQSGVVLVVLAIVLLGYALAGSVIPSIVGAVVGAVGLGLLGAAAIGYWLADRWGMLSVRGGRHPVE